MSVEYIEVDLDNEQKAAILKYAGFFVMDAVSKKDLAKAKCCSIIFKFIFFSPFHIYLHSLSYLQEPL